MGDGGGGEVEVAEGSWTVVNINLVFSDGSIHWLSNNNQIQQAYLNRRWVQFKIAEKGWTDSVERQAEYLIELGRDRVRRETRGLL